MAITYPYWNNDEVISSDKLNSMVQAIVNGDPLAVKVSNATKNDVNQIISYLSSLYNSAKTNLNSATSTNDFDTAYTNMTALVSNKLGSYANDDTVDLYSTGIRASIITFLQAHDTMMSNDRLNNKNTDNTLNGRIDNEAQARSDNDNAINAIISSIQANGGGRNLAIGTASKKSDKPQWGADGGQISLDTLKSLRGQWITISCDMSWTGFAKSDKASNRIGYELGLHYSDGTYLYINNWYNPSNSEANKSFRFSRSWKLPDKELTSIDEGWLYNQIIATTCVTSKLMIEKGTVAHDWQPAPEDVEAKITALDAKTMQNRGTVNAPDFNSLTQAGYYTITNLSTGQNYPTTNWGTLEVSGQVSDTNGRLNQKYVSDSGGTIYTRQYNAGTKVWTSWVQMATQNDINSVKDLVNSKTNTTDINWTNVVANSNNTYNYASGSHVTLPNNSSITVNDDRIIHHIYLPTYFTDYTNATELNALATSGECDNLFIPSATMATLNSRPTNPDTNAPLTGDCFYTCHYAYSGTTVRAFQKLYSCDYNYVFIRSYNGSSQSWSNWSCLTPYA